MAGPSRTLLHKTNKAVQGWTWRTRLDAADVAGRDWMQLDAARHGWLDTARHGLKRLDMAGQGYPCTLRLSQEHGGRWHAKIDQSTTRLAKSTATPRYGWTWLDMAGMAEHGWRWLDIAGDGWTHPGTAGHGRHGWIHFGLP